MQLKKSLLCGIFGLALSSALLAQPKDNDPYSSLGLGNLFNRNLPGSAGMGSLGATWHDPFHTNLVNPASLGHLYMTALEAGAFAQYRNLEAADASNQVWAGNISHFVLAFPLQNPLNRLTSRRRSPVQWGMSISLTPFSDVGYDIRTDQEVPDVGTVSTLAEGSGGSYQIAWGNGWRYKSFSLGLNLGYLFGKSTREQSEFFTDQPYSFYNNRVEEQSLGGLIWNLGLLYEYTFPMEEALIKDNRPRTHLAFGAYGRSAGDVGSSNTFLITRRGSTSIDTISSSNGVVDGNVRLPAEFGAGLMLSRDNAWKIGLDFNQATWSQYRNDLRPSTLSDAWRLALGGEWVPEARSYNNYFKRMRYRAGLFYGTDPRTAPNGEQLRQYGLNLGFGFPLPASRGVPSSINTALEIGRIGLPDYIDQTYFRLNFGITLNDNSWFYKQKFD